MKTALPRFSTSVNSAHRALPVILRMAVLPPFSTSVNSARRALVLLVLLVLFLLLSFLSYTRDVASIKR